MKCYKIYIGTKIKTSQNIRTKKCIFSKINERIYVHSSRIDLLVVSCCQYYLYVLVVHGKCY